jgi:hypothetical protein
MPSFVPGMEAEMSSDLGLTAGADARPLSRAVPADIGDGWALSAPEAVGLDPKALCGAIDWLDGLPNANATAS